MLNLVFAKYIQTYMPSSCKCYLSKQLESRQMVEYFTVAKFKHT